MKTKKNLCNYIIFLNKKDNVGTCIRDISAGGYLYSYKKNKSIINIKKMIKAGFKVSLCRIGRNEKIIKYGTIIGFAKADINPGQRVHIENITSLIKNG